MKRVIFKIIINPGFKAVFLYRMQQYFQRKQMWLIANIISGTNQFLTGAELCIGCDIGSNLIIRHPSGIVIGGGVTIGNYTIIQKGVVIGAKYSKSLPSLAYPKIHNNVEIGTNAAILGDVIVSNNVSIGALTLVIKSVPSNKVVVGNPARILDHNK